MAVDVTLKAEIVAVLGASGSGKSAYIKGEIRRRRPARSIIYDPEGEYLAFGRRVESLAAVHSVLIQAAGGKPFKLVFAPHADPAKAIKQYDMLCRMAFFAGDVLFVAEELADVTTPQRAPVGWSMVSRRGRKRGVEVIGASQRPANIDKNFLANCSRVRSGRLLYEADARAVGAVLGVDWRELLALPPLHYFEREAPAPAVRGVLTFN